MSKTSQKIQVRGWSRSLKIFGFGESFSLKSLKNYYADRKETEVDINNGISYCDFYDTYSNNLLGTICKIIPNCLKF